MSNEVGSVNKVNRVIESNRVNKSNSLCDGLTVMCEWVTIDPNCGAYSRAQFRGVTPGE